MKRRIWCGAITALLVYSLLPCQVSAVDTSATAAILIDADSGRILYEHNADQKMRIASTTKILTALVAIEQGNLAEQIKISREAACTEGSAMYLKEGETLSLETLLYGLLLCSGNDAAVAIAQAVSGSVDRFVKQMNETAQALGMEHSSFANPNGLDDENHYSTARDMACLAQAALENETLMRIASTRSVTIGGRTMQNHNKLLSWLDGCLGLKTGYTKAAGRTLVSCAERNGQRLIAVTLQDGNDWADHQTLHEYGFETYPARNCATRGRALTWAAVTGSLTASVPLVAEESFFWPTAEGEKLTRKVVLDRELTAPVKAGETVGAVVFYLDGEEIGRVSLAAGRSAEPKRTSALDCLKRGVLGQ